MKKIVALLLIVCIDSCFICIPSYAANNESITVTPYYLYTLSATSTLSISSSTATCTSELSSGSSVTKIVSKQYLEKKGLLGSWSTVTSGTWTKTIDTSYSLMINTKSNLGGGAYRLRTVFTVYSGSSSEEIEKISSKMKVYEN